jgi:hypothetical protein
VADELFTREEVLGGLPARRAATLLFLIETRTAHLVAQSREALQLFLTEELVKERDRVFLDAFNLGQPPPRRPTIQELETHARLWAPLVPQNPSVQAAVGHLLGQKYSLTAREVPGIRAALGLDTTAVQRAYERLYHAPLATLYVLRPTLGERLRWLWATLARWLETLSPFWAAFSLTLTGIIRNGVLALPIAIAGIGPLPGMILLLLFGLIGFCTVVSLAEAVARNGTMRYGRAFMGRITADYLGQGSSLLLSGVMWFNQTLRLLVTYIGAPLLLASATHVPASIWATVFFGYGVYAALRGLSSETVALSLLVAAINISLILFLSLLAFSHMHLEYLLYVNVPFLDGRPFDPLVLQALFGTALGAFIGGSNNMVNVASLVLRRDASARSLIWGSAIAIVVSIMIYSIWVLAVNGAVPSESLMGQRGTALGPLAVQIGPIVQVVGVVLAILMFGMSAGRVSLNMSNLVSERLPVRAHTVVTLPRRRQRVLLQPRGVAANGVRLGLTYLGLTDGMPRCRVDVQCNGHMSHSEITVTGRWNATTLFARLPELRTHGINLTLETLDATQQSVHLRVSTGMLLTYADGWDTVGLSPSDVLTLPDAQRQLVNWMLRQGEVNLAQVAAHCRQPAEAVHSLLSPLVQQGFVRERQVHGTAHYRASFAPTRGRQITPEIWQALETGDDPHAPGSREARPARWRVVLYRIKQALVSERGRSVLSVSPIILVFLVAEWLLATGGASFTRIIGFTGVVAGSLMSGVFPVLLLAASRRKGEYVPGVVFRFLGSPWVAVPLYIFFVGNLFLHGLVIWQHPVERTAALVAGMLMLSMTVVMIRRGAFTPRLVVELRHDQRTGDDAVLTIVAGGHPAAAAVRLHYADGEQAMQTVAAAVPTFSALHAATVQLPPTTARELKVWAYAVTAEGQATDLAGLLEVHTEANTQQFDLQLCGGQVIVPLRGGVCWIKFIRPDAAGA